MQYQNVYRLCFDGHLGKVFFSEISAFEEANRFLSEFPESIVMLIELEFDRCKHCNSPILEKAGWVLHKWVHYRTGAHLCWMSQTQAEPEEEVVRKFKLIILCQYDPWAKMKNDEQELDLDFNLEQAEFRALRWLMYRPNDIVMLEPV